MSQTATSLSSSRRRPSYNAKNEMARTRILGRVPNKYRHCFKPELA